MTVRIGGFDLIYRLLVVAWRSVRRDRVRIQPIASSVSSRSSCWRVCHVMVTNGPVGLAMLATDASSSGRLNQIVAAAFAYVTIKVPGDSSWLNRAFTASTYYQIVSVLLAGALPIWWCGLAQRPADRPSQIAARAF